MKHFECKTIDKECDWKVDAESDEELLQKAEQHGREAHGLQGLTPELKEQIKANITEVKAA